MDIHNSNNLYAIIDNIQKCKILKFKIQLCFNLIAKPIYEHAPRKVKVIRATKIRSDCQILDALIDDRLIDDKRMANCYYNGNSGNNPGQLKLLAFSNVQFSNFRLIVSAILVP